MRRTRTPRRGRRFGIVGLALALLGGLLLTIPTLASAKDTINYTIVFDNGGGKTTTVTGTATDKDAFIPDAGGTDPENPTGVIMHLSCSDEFPGGWGEKEGPDPVQDAAWRVKSFTIQKGDKTCSGGDPIPPPSPAIDVEKATNGEDADEPTGPEIKIGDPVTWTYVVTNTGDTALSNVELLDYVGEIGDSDPTTIDCPRDELGVGESMTCEATGTAMEGQYRNTAKVTAEGPAASPIASDDKKKQYTFIFVDPATGDTTRIDGSSEKNEAFLPNAGGTDQQAPFPGMTVHVSCSDDFPGGYGKKDGPDPVADSAWQIQSFWIREVKDGEIKKQCGNPIPNTQMVMDDDPSHYIGVPGDPAIDIEKATNGIDADTPDEGPELFAGDTVTWTYVVTNTGDVDLENVTVEDDPEGLIGTISFLAVGESVELTETGTVGEGNYRNEACARAMDEDGNEVDDCDPSHYNVPDPDIDIEKATNGVDADDPSDAPQVEVGDDITWTYVVTNTGDQDLVDVEVTDDEEGFIGTIGFLAVGDSATLTARGTAEAGLYGNVGCATGETEDDGRPVEDCDPSHYRAKKGDYPDFPSIDIEKATNGHDADEPTGPKVAAGSTVTWTYEVTNTGHEKLYGVFVYDEGEWTAIDCPEHSLEAGESMTCELTGTARHGQYANEAWVTAWTDTGMVRDADWSHYYGTDDGRRDASVDIEKATNGHDADEPTGPKVAAGSTVTWTYEVTNTGGETLYGVFVYDEGEWTAIDCPEHKLRAGESMTCELRGEAGHGQYANEAWVTAWTDTGMVRDSDWSHYYGTSR